MQTKQTKILALDLGSKCGFALGDGRQVIASGTWDLSPTRQRRFEGAGMKWVRLRGYLDVLDLQGVSLVVIEEVRRHLGVDAAHAYGGCLAVVTQWCEHNSVPYHSFPVGTIKKHATGKGNANKGLMLAAATRKGWSPCDDNEADALWILDLQQTKPT